MKKELENSGLVGKILLDLSKTYDCLPHNLLIAKLEAYGPDKPSLNLVNGFRSKGKKLALCIVTGLMLLRVFPRDPF